MATYPAPVQELIDELGKLPGIGPKSAQRVAFHLVRLPTEDALKLASAIGTVKETVAACERCFNVTDVPWPACADDSRSLCSGPRAEADELCVVEEPKDIVAVERTGEFEGRYHVLQGAISPLNGVGPDQLRMRELLARIENEGIREVILCTNPNLEGETTAAFLAAKVLAPFDVKVSRLASGLPVGGDLEYADELTLGRALEGRNTVDS